MLQAYGTSVGGTMYLGVGIAAASLYLLGD